MENGFRQTTPFDGIPNRGTVSSPVARDVIQRSLLIANAITSLVQ